MTKVTDVRKNKTSHQASTNSKRKKIGQCIKLSGTR